jgi:hypothetical protein
MARGKIPGDRSSRTPMDAAERLSALHFLTTLSLMFTSVQLGSDSLST